MDSEKLIIDKSAIEERVLENIHDPVTDHNHPKVTAKKTFFDLHHARRSRSAGTAETNYHPKIKWTAGTTEIGSAHETTTTYSDYMEQDIMKPVLQREPSTPDPVSPFLHTSRSNLPAVSVTWEPMDIQPTRLEEIQHLLEPCPIISRPDNEPEVAKPKKKFLDKFRKRSKPVTPDSGEKVMSHHYEVEKILPEKEFRLLNERYIREGIIPVETVKKHEYFAASLPQFTLENLEDKGSEEVEMNFSSLPARRSCEPVDIKDVRKLRDSDSKPGPSGINQQKNVEDGEEALFTTQTPKISIFDARADVDEIEISQSESQEDFRRIIEETASKIDRFKIDNPFSDFSLQTIKQQKSILKQEITGSSMKKKPQNRQSTLPSTSKATYPMDYRPKVSYNLNNEKSDKTVMVTSSQSIFRKVSKKGTLEVESKKRAFDETLGFTFFSSIMHRVTDRNIILTQIYLKSDGDHFNDTKMRLGYCDENFQSILTPLMENLINPTFENFLKNHLPNFSTRLNEASSKIVTAKNDAWNDIIKVFSNACPKAINNILNISQIWNKNIDNTENEETHTDRNFTTLLNSPEYRENVIFPVTLNSSVRMDKIMEKIVDFVVNVTLRQDLIPEFLFLSFSPKATLISNRRDFEGSYRFYSRLENYHSFPLNSVALPVELINLYKTSFYFNKSTDLERRDNSSDMTLNLFANVTAFPAHLEK